MAEQEIFYNFVILTWWWGHSDVIFENNKDDNGIPFQKVVELLFQSGEKYGIKIGLHLEPYSGRTAKTVVEDIKVCLTPISPQFQSLFTEFSPSIHPFRKTFLDSAERFRTFRDICTWPRNISSDILYLWFLSNKTRRLVSRIFKNSRYRMGCLYCWTYCWRKRDQPKRLVSNGSSGPDGLFDWVGRTALRSLIKWIILRPF